MENATIETGIAVNIRVNDNPITSTEFWGADSCDAAMAYYKALDLEAKGNWHQFQPIERQL